ncbi:MAG: hypothetical protein ACREXR_08765 [Gammaproteobacteria bacterium]
MRHLVLTAVLVLASGCATSKTASQAMPGTFEGSLYISFEQSEFHSCEGEVFWVVNPGDFLAVSKEAFDKGRAIRVLGFKSPEGEYGHLGAYRRQLEITKAEVGTRTPDCGVAP